MKPKIDLSSFAKWIILAVAIIAVSGWRIEAQTNIAPVLSTNLVAAAPSFREVNGQLYNTERSTLWTSLKGRCLDVGTNGIEIVLIVPTYDRADSSPEWNGWAGPPNQMVVVGEHESDKIIFVKNYPTNRNIAVTQQISFRAMQAGTINYKGVVLELWDYGKPHIAMVVTTNYPHAFKADGK
jgi:hypothetical protein